MANLHNINLDLRHLKLVAAVAEEGSITRAGKRLHLTQSALSHQLRDAEDKLGTPIFLRLRKRMVLTPAGERLLDSARRVLQEMERAEDEIRGLGGQRRGQLRLSTECYTCYHWLPSLLKSYQRQFPGVEVQIDVGATRRPLAALLEGKLDLAIVSGTVPPDRHLVAHPLFEDEMVAVVGKDHRLASRPVLRPKDFAEETLLIYGPANESRVLQRYLLPAGAPPRQVLEVQLTEAMLELVKAGLGVAVLARWAVAPYARAGVVKGIPLAQQALRRQWHAVMLKDHTPEYLLEFVKMIAEHALPVRDITRAPRRALAAVAAG